MNIYNFLKLNRVFFNNGYVIIKFLPIKYELGNISLFNFVKFVYLFLTSIGYQEIDPRIAKFLNQPIVGKNITISLVFIDFENLVKFDESIANTSLHDKQLKYYFTVKPNKCDFIYFCKTFFSAMLKNFDFNIYSIDKKIYIKKLSTSIKGGEFTDIYDTRKYGATYYFTQHFE